MVNGRFGRKRLMVTALLGFAGLSFLLTLTTEFGPFIALRLLQGASLGCIFVPAAVLLFTSLPLSALKYAPPAFVLVSLSGSTLGTVIGGYLADAYGGSAVFLPGCVSTLIIAGLIFLAVKTNEQPQYDLRIDIAGVMLSMLSFGAL